MSCVKLHLGCGTQMVEGWVNVDYSLGARLCKIPGFARLNKKSGFFRSDWDRGVLVHDLRRRFPFKNDSAHIVYTSHTLEHFTREEGLRLLRECRRVLMPEGVIRVVVPDLDAFVARYVEGETPATEFVEKLGVLPAVSGR